MDTKLESLKSTFSSLCVLLSGTAIGQNLASRPVELVVPKPSHSLQTTKPVVGRGRLLLKAMASADSQSPDSPDNASEDPSSEFEQILSPLAALERLTSMDIGLTQERNRNVYYATYLSGDGEAQHRRRVRCSFAMPHYDHGNLPRFRSYMSGSY